MLGACVALLGTTSTASAHEPLHTPGGECLPGSQDPIAPYERFNRGTDAPLLIGAAGGGVVDLVHAQENTERRQVSDLLGRVYCSELAGQPKLVDGTHVLPLVTVRDHKPLLDGNRRPNTGGMGGFARPADATPDSSRWLGRLGELGEKERNHPLRNGRRPHASPTPAPRAGRPATPRPRRRPRGRVPPGAPPGRA